MMNREKKPYFWRLKSEPIFFRLALICYFNESINAESYTVCSRCVWIFNFYRIFYLKYCICVSGKHFPEYSSFPLSAFRIGVSKTYFARFQAAVWWIRNEVGFRCMPSCQINLQQDVAVISSEINLEIVQWSVTI